MFKFILYLLFMFSQIDPSLYDTIDYFTEDFSPYKNCQNKKQLLIQVKNNMNYYCNKYPLAKNITVDIQNKFELCQKDLSQKLNTACGGKLVKETGILSYCTSRGDLYCCFSKHKCQEWDETGAILAKQALDYLNNRTHYLRHYLIKDVGYKTCHHLKNYDATSCAEDCKLFENSNFSKSCSKQSGLFKCCIRRDAVCDQCKFCCTLPVCTYKNDTTIFDIPKNANMTSSERIYKNAKEIYSTNTLIYKSYDYRCLKPDSDKNPEKWKHYDMSNFRAAVNKQDLSKVPAYKFYKLMYNYFDINVLKKYLSAKGNKVTEKAYGFDYCAKVAMYNYTECSIQCIKAETSKFAKDCRKKNGLFKCCMTPSFIKPFYDINIAYWAKMGLKKKPKRICFGRHSKGCNFCCATYACTKLDKKTKKRITKFKTKLKPGKRVGGLREGVGIRFSVCYNQDYCNTEFLKWETFSPQKKYQEAITLEEVCKLGTKLWPIGIPFHISNKTETGLKSAKKSFCPVCISEEYKQMTINRKRKCLENPKKSPFSNINVKTCSPSSLKKLKMEELKNVNEYLNKIKRESKKSKGKHYEKSSKEKRVKCKPTGKSKNSSQSNRKEYIKCKKHRKNKKKKKEKRKKKVNDYNDYNDYKNITLF